MHPANSNTSTPNTGPGRDVHAASPGTVFSWLLLAHLKGVTPRLFNRLLDVHGSPETILDCTPADLHACGVDMETARAIQAAGAGRLPDPEKARIESCMAWLDSPGHRVVHRGSPAYPHRLAAIPDPPPLLYVAGNPETLDHPMLAIVGSRHPSAEGRRNARRFAAELAGRGFGVCSGLALGIDEASHSGALAEGGKTVAVLGTGIDRVYPARNADLFQAIAERGALVSEFNPGTPPLPAHFPQRNRIISGLSLGVLVVEAGLQSGSMITARMALEQGRDVFAIPGSIHNPMAKGCHHLISQGAKLVQSVADITEEFDLVQTPIPAWEDEEKDAVISGNVSMARELAIVLAAVGHDPLPLDALLPETGMTVEAASAALVELELGGLVRREATGFVRAVPD